MVQPGANHVIRVGLTIEGDALSIFSLLDCHIHLYERLPNMTGKQLLDLDDYVLSQIGFFLSDNGVGEKPVPIPVGSPIGRVKYSNHLLRFTATCRRIRKLVPLSGLSFGFEAERDWHQGEDFKNQSWLTNIPLRIKRSISHVDIIDYQQSHYYGSAKPQPTIIRSVLSKLPSITSLTYESTGSGCRRCPRSESRQPKTRPKYKLRSLFLNDLPSCCAKTLERTVLEDCPALTHLQHYRQSGPHPINDFGRPVMSRLKSLSIGGFVDSAASVEDLVLTVAKSCPSLEELTALAPWTYGVLALSVEQNGADTTIFGAYTKEHTEQILQALGQMKTLQKLNGFTYTTVYPTASPALQNAPKVRHAFDLSCFSRLADAEVSKSECREAALRSSVERVAEKLREVCPTLNGGWLEVTDSTGGVPGLEPKFLWEWSVVEAPDGVLKATANTRGIPTHLLKATPPGRRPGAPGFLEEDMDLDDDSENDDDMDLWMYENEDEEDLWLDESEYDSADMW